MKKYIITFFITSAIFLSAFFISDRVNVSRLDQLNNVQEKISLNILATETRFALLKEASCENVFEGSALEIGITKDLNQLVTRIKFLENELGSSNEDVKILKQRYTLLQIKDYLLVQELSKKCDYTIATVIYFHTSDCFDCRKQSIVLDRIRQEYNNVRVYWMDASINEPAMETLERLYAIEIYPTLILGSDIYSGFISYEDFSQQLNIWAQKNSAILTTLTDTELTLVNNAIGVIQESDKYINVSKENISFIRVTDNRYEFLVVTKEGSEPESVGLELDADSNFIIIEQ